MSLEEIEGMLDDEPISFKVVYDDLIMEWYEKAELAQPLLIHLIEDQIISNDSIVEYFDNFPFDDIFLFSLAIGSEEEPVRLLFVFRDNFYAVDMFGTRLLPDEFKQIIEHFEDEESYE